MDTHHCIPNVLGQRILIRTLVVIIHREDLRLLTCGVGPEGEAILHQQGADTLFILGVLDDLGEDLLVLCVVIHGDAAAIPRKIIGTHSEIFNIQYHAVQRTAQLRHLIEKGGEQIFQERNAVVQKQNILGHQLQIIGDTENSHIAGACGTGIQARFHGFGQLGHLLIGVAAVEYGSAVVAQLGIFTQIADRKRGHAVQRGIFGRLKTRPAQGIEGVFANSCADRLYQNHRNQHNQNQQQNKYFFHLFSPFGYGGTNEGQKLPITNIYTIKRRGMSM